MMGLPTEIFFMMMLKMMWFRDVVGLVVKGLLFGALPAAICCYRGAGARRGRRRAGQRRHQPVAPGPWAGAALVDMPVFRAACLSCVAILIMNSSWFMLVYHAVPFYGPTLLAPPRPVNTRAAARNRDGPREGAKMSTRSTARDVWVGLIVIVAVAGLIALVSMASDGPGFLAPQRTIDVVFRDAQGIRIGSSVRVAGLDTGNVVDVDLVEVEGMLRARVRISLPAALVKKLRQDVKVSIVPALTGMSHVNVLSTGRSAVALVPGQSIPGVETSFFDPIIEQVGLGPVERNHLSHTIAEVRQTVDSVGPAAAADAGLAPGDDDQPARHERLDPAGRRIDGRPRRGPDPEAERQLTADREDHRRTSRADRRGARLPGRQSRERQADAGLGPRLHRLAQPHRGQGPAQGREAARRRWKRREPAPTACSTRPTRSPARCRTCWHAAARKSSDP